MSYTIEMMENGPALVVSLGEDFDFATEGETSFGQIIGMLDQQTEPVVYIVDLHKVDFSFDETMAVIEGVTRGENPLLYHKNIKEIIYVVGDTLQRMVAAGLSSEVFGNLKIKAVDTLEGALKYIRSK